jgi:hypothetical protein
MAKKAIKKDCATRGVEEHKTVTSATQEALFTARQTCLRKQLRDLHDYWSHRAKEKGILSEADLERYLRWRGSFGTRQAEKLTL